MKHEIMNGRYFEVFLVAASFRNAAKEKLSRYGYDQMNSNSTVFISIHVRLTDYKTVLKDLQTIPKRYFTRAMKYFYEKYKVSLILFI